MTNEIVWLTTSLTNQNYLIAFCKHNDLKLSVYKTDFETCLDTTSQVRSQGAKVIICRGEIAHIITDNTSVPVVQFQNPLTQFYRAIKTAYQFSYKVALVGWYKNVLGLKEFCEIVDANLIYVELEELSIQSYQENIDNIVLNLEQQGVDAIIGNEAVVEASRRIGIPAYYVGLNPQAVFDAVEAAKRQLELIKEQQKHFDFMASLVNSISEGIITVNNDLSLTTVNLLAEDILGLSRNSWKGKHLNQVLPLTNISRTIYDGYKIVNQVFVKDGLQLVVNASPLVTPTGENGAIISIQRASNLLTVERKIRKTSIEKNLLAKKTFDDIIGSSPVIIRTKETARLYAKTNSTVLITGESGVGKELFAQSMHNESGRKSCPFLAFNCGAVPESLLESELFGYVRGAFTGASAEGKIGIFEQAHGGTLFLDEISELSPSAQVRLLRVLQEKEITRIGETRVTPIDVRIFTACNKNLMDEVEKGTFRRDLYYRLYVLHLDIPPLRFRGDDIIELLYYFLREHNQDQIRFSPAALLYIQSYQWPGNIRELNNFAERVSVLLADQAEELDVENIQSLLHMDTAPTYSSSLRSEIFKQNPVVNSRKNLEDDRILEVLKQCGNNKLEAAKQLGISTTTLWRHLKKFQAGIESQD